MIVYKYVSNILLTYFVYMSKEKKIDMKVRKFELIECPHCGYEYLPSEIFLPKYYFGKPFNIVRDDHGKIVTYEGTSIDLFEKYICDNCNEEFRVVSKLQLTTESEFPGSFSEEYVSKLKMVK